MRYTNTILIPNLFYLKIKKNYIRRRSRRLFNKLIRLSFKKVLNFYLYINFFKLRIQSLITRKRRHKLVFFSNRKLKKYFRRKLIFGFFSLFWLFINIPFLSLSKNSFKFRSSQRLITK